MLEWLEHFRRKICTILVIGGCALLFATLLGGILFKLEAPVIFGWFIIVVAAFFLATLLVALVTFLIWYLFTSPIPMLIFMGILAGILGIAYIFITKMNPALDLGETFSSMFGFLNK